RNIKKKKSEIASLKSELTNLKNELVLKISELDYQKSEAISKPVISGDDEKNTQSEEQSSITKTDDISLGSTDLSKYFIRKKNTLCEEQSYMDPIEKIDSNISTYTSDEITELPKNDIAISPKINEENNISEISEDITPQPQEIPNVTPYLAQPENNSGASAKAHMSSLIESNSQIPIGGIGSIPIVASTLMSPLSAYIFLTLLIIAVVWFV